MVTPIDKPNYYKCNSIEAVQDAFSIHDFDATIPTVYLEGRTDEKYFRKATEVFDMNVPFRFKWIGYMKDGQERFTGSNALNKAFDFLVANGTTTTNVCLFDCDTNKEPNQAGNIFIRAMQYYSNTKQMEKGIENALVLDEIDIDESFYICEEKPRDYGGKCITTTFNKMAFCDYICGMDKQILQKVFKNLYNEIQQLILLFEK